MNFEKKHLKGLHIWSLSKERSEKRGSNSREEEEAEGKNKNKKGKGGANARPASRERTNIFNNINMVS